MLAPPTWGQGDCSVRDKVQSDCSWPGLMQAAECMGQQQELHFCALCLALLDNGAQGKKGF